MTNGKDSLVLIALSYARNGWAVFPVHSVQYGRCSCGKDDCASPGKHPRTEHGVKDATTDESTIRAWWKRFPDANIGVATGAVSGIVALDCDRRHGGANAIKGLQQQYGDLPETVLQLTPGGWHWILAHPGHHVASSSGTIAPGIDIKGDGGYIVVPPSIHESGNRYSWHLEPDDTELAAMPDWLLEKCKPQHKKASPVGDVIEDGERNATLASLAGTMRRRGMTASEIGAALSVVNGERCKPPLEESEIIKIAESVARYEPAQAEKKVKKSGQGQPLIITDAEPHPDPVDGQELLEDVCGLFRRFISMPIACVVAVVLWIVHTYVLEAFEVTPRLGITSPTKRCGKTRVLELLAALVSRPLSAANITAAAVFRSIAKYHPTLLIDEADTFLRDNDDLRGVLNSGHTRSTAYVARTQGQDHEVELFSTWGAVAVALIGKLPATLEDRCVEIQMQRRRPGDHVEKLRGSRLKDICGPIQRKLTRWAKDNLAALKEADPELPDALDDRAGDNWSPLLAIADVVGGEWPSKARETAMSLSAGRDEAEAVCGVQALEDLRSVFDGAEAVKTDDILSAFHDMEERPWPEFGRAAKPITARQLAKLFRPFGISPKTVRVTGGTAKGYRLPDCQDAFTRYLPPLNPSQASHPDTTTSYDKSYPSQDPSCYGYESSQVLTTQRCDGCDGSEPPKGEESANGPVRVAPIDRCISAACDALDAEVVARLPEDAGPQQHELKWVQQLNGGDLGRLAGRLSQSQRDGEDLSPREKTQLDACRDELRVRAAAAFGQPSQVGKDPDEDLHKSASWPTNESQEA